MLTLIQPLRIMFLNAKFPETAEISIFRERSPGYTSEVRNEVPDPRAEGES